MDPEAAAAGMSTAGVAMGAEHEVHLSEDEAAMGAEHEVHLAEDEAATGTFHLVTKECVDGNDVVSVTWLPHKMPSQKGGDQVRYHLSYYPKLRGTLLDTAVEVLNKLGFGSLLEIKMHNLHERNFPVWAASLCKPAKCGDEEAIVFVIEKSRPVVMTKDAVKVLTGLPVGDQTVPEDLLQSPTAAEVKDNLKSALKTASEKTTNWKPEDVFKACDKAKTENDHMLQVRLFIAFVFEFGIFTSASHYLSAENLGRVCDLKKLVTTDWCKALIAHMQRCLQTFDHTLRVFSPLTFSLFCMENVDCPQIMDHMEIPRMKYYEEGVFRDNVAAFMTGVKLKDWKNTIFGRNKIAEVQASEIKYAENFKKEPKKRKAKEMDNKGALQKKPKSGEKSTHDSNKHADIDRDILDFYKEYVVKRTRDEIVLNILDHEVSEMQFVECFKDKGYMHTSIMFLQCALWNKEWKEQGIDQVILSQKAMLELLNPEQGSSTLTAELLTGENQLQANLIFVPIVYKHHWFLIVIAHDKKIYILDSFPSESRVPVIYQILKTLSNLLGPDYISDVVEVLPQKNNHDCGFHVLLYINGFDDKNVNQICGVNKDMVDKFRIETAKHLRCHELNKPAEARIVVSNDDDDPEILENSFSYDSCRFNAVLCGEEDSGPFLRDDDHNNLNLSDTSPSKIPDHDRSVHTNTNPTKIPDDDGNKLERNMSTDTSSTKIPDDDGNKLERNVSRDSKATDRKADRCYQRRPKPAKQEQQQEKTSAVMKSRCERQQRPSDDFSTLYDRRTRPFIRSEDLEEAYKLAVGCKEEVILKFQGISMTGPQLEKCLQGGQDARDLIIIFTELLDKFFLCGTKRIFISPLDKDDEHLKEKIQNALLPLRKDNPRAANLPGKMIIYLPVFFSGEWIVVCFLSITLKNQIHVYCHNDSFQEVRTFALSMRETVSKALKEITGIEVSFPTIKVACTESTIKANGSAAASMYFIENFLGTRRKIQFDKFKTEHDELQDKLVERIKYEVVMYLLGHRDNEGSVPDAVLKILRKKNGGN